MFFAAVSPSLLAVRYLLRFNSIFISLNPLYSLFSRLQFYCLCVRFLAFLARNRTRINILSQCGLYATACLFFISSLICPSTVYVCKLCKCFLAYLALVKLILISIPYPITPAFVHAYNQSRVRLLPGE